MIAILVGTRPELIKMAPVMRQLDAQNTPYLFIHSNQHYSDDLDTKIIRDLQLKPPDFNLQVGSGSHAVQTGKIMEGVEKICVETSPNVLVVHGDTNTTLGGALTAKKLHIPVAHIEAGLRSFDYRMPEEVNRILVDRISDILFAPTKIAKKNLLHEGIDDKIIVVTGNTIADAVAQHGQLTHQSTLLTDHSLQKNKYIVVTLHRAENVDDQNQLTRLLALIDHAARHLGQPIVWPIHPRTQHKLTEFGISLPASYIILPPVGYIEMLSLLQNAALVLTDSGGIQEEAYLLRKPLMTLRTSTERPETLTANVVIGDQIELFDAAWQQFQEKRVQWKPAFGTGHAAEIIIKALAAYV